MPARDSYLPGEFCWFDLASTDRFAAAEFYRDVFAWQAEWNDGTPGPPYAELSIDGAVVAGLGELSTEMQAAGVPPVWNAYIAVDDVRACVDRVVQLDGSVVAPPQSIGPAGDLAFVSDPTGATFGLWQAGTHRGAGRFGDPGACCWNELATTDLHEACEFFGDLFGWQFRNNDAAPGPYRIARLPDSPDGVDVGGLMQITPEWGDVPSHFVNYFAVSDAAATLAAVRSAGGQVMVEPFDTPYGKIAVLADAQGARFNIWQRAARSD